MIKRNWPLYLLFALVLVLLWLLGRREAAAPADRAPAVTYDAIPSGSGGSGRELLVDLIDEASDEQVRQLASRFALTLRPNSQFSRAIRLYRAPIGKRGALARLLRRLRDDPLVERAEVEAVYAIPPLEQRGARGEDSELPQWKDFPNDPKFRYQWHLDQIGMRSAWKRGQGSGVVVAVIDTGVAYRDRGRRFRAVPDLAETEVVAGYDFVNDDEEALDDHGHGTHVAGTIAQSTHNGLGVAGVAFKAKIMPLKVLSKRGFGNVADIAEAVRFAADHGAHVINMSLGGPRASRVLESAVRYAYRKGVLVVCAAGNDGRGRVSYPAAYRGAVAVAATQFDRSTTFYSNWGKEIDLAAPGGNTRVDQNNDGMPDGVLQNTIVIGKPAQNDYLLFMGTSMATPHVAGAAALVIGAGARTPDAALKVLTRTAKHPGKKKWDERYGAGIVDASAALKQVRDAWGGFRLALATLLGLFLFAGLKRRGQLGLRPGPLTAMGLLVGASGLFFLPALGLTLPAPMHWLARGFPAWDTTIVGATSRAHPLFFSIFAPLALTAVLYGVRRLRGLLCGFTVGIAAHLLFAAALGLADVSWVPNILGLDALWLVLNALGCLGLARLVAKR